MSRKIPNDAPLSDADRAYLHARGEHARVEMLDARYPATDADAGNDPVPPATDADAGNDPVPPATDADAGNDPKEPEPEATEDDYEDWTVSELQDELDKRSLAKTGKKPELISRLRANDAE